MGIPRWPPNPQRSERPGDAVALLYSYGGPDMAPTPPTFGAPRRRRGAPLPTACPRQKNGAGSDPGPVMQSREGCLFVVGPGLDLDGLELELAATPLQAVLATHAGLNFR